ncbi:MAG: RNA polymerase sigma factor, partial [Bacteroidota bacterium]
MKTIIDSSPSLIEITQSAIRGDTLSLGTLFQYYRPRLYAHALRVCGNTALAQDAVQDTFISAYTHISSLRDPTVVYPWLRKMLFNNCYMLFRKEKSLLNRNSAIQIDTLVQDSIDQNFEQSFNQQIIYELMSRLSDELSSCL